MKYLLIALFLFPIFSCNYKPDQKPKESPDFFTETQKEFFKKSGSFYGARQDAVNELGKNLVKQEQEKWMKNYFDTMKQFKAWVGKFHLKGVALELAGFEIADNYHIRYATNGVCLAKDTLLYNKLAKIPDSAIVTFSAKCFGVTSFAHDATMLDDLGIPVVGIILDSIEVLPVKF